MRGIEAYGQHAQAFPLGLDRVQVKLWQSNAAGEIKEPRVFSQGSKFWIDQQPHKPPRVFLIDLFQTFERLFALSHADVNPGYIKIVEMAFFLSFQQRFRLFPRLRLVPHRENLPDSLGFKSPSVP